MDIDRIKELLKLYEDGILTKGELEHGIESHIISGIVTATENGGDYYWISFGMRDPSYVSPTPIILEIEYVPRDYKIRRKSSE